MTVVATIEQLEAIYGFPNDASTVKVADRVTPAYRALMDKSPFAALATCGPEGLDCSPRGDLPGFVRVHDEKTLMMPDRRGNNRCDSLRNIVRDPRVALLFLIPGSGSTLRINGRAHVSADPDLLASFNPEGECRQLPGRGLRPRLSIGTLQLSSRCSSIHFLPRRSFPVSDDPLAGTAVSAFGAVWSGCLSCAKAPDAKHIATRKLIDPR